MHLIETASFGARAAGRLLGRPALGTTIHHSLFTGSRFLLVIFLPILGYLVETGISYERYFFTITISLFGAFLGSFFIVIKFNTIQHFFQKIFALYQDSTIPGALLKSIFRNSKIDLKYINLNANLSINQLIVKKVLVSFVAYTFLCTGFFLAFLLALKYTEYRLTLSQFTAVFHGLGAIIVSFYLDPMLSRSIDAIKEENIWLNNLYSILIGRVISYLVASLLFLIFYYLFFV